MRINALSRLMLLTVLLSAVPAYAQRRVPIIAGTVTVNVTQDTQFQIILTANVTAVTLTTVSSTPNGLQVTLIFTQDATGGRTVAFGGNITTSCVIASTANITTYCRLQYLSATNAWLDSAGGSPAGSNTQVQYNNSGAFGGTTATWDAVNGAILAPNGLSTHPAYSFTSSTGTGMWTNGTGVIFSSGGTNIIQTSATGVSINVPVSAPNYATVANCTSSASPAVCGSVQYGSVVIAASATTVQVNTTAVSANSQIQLTRDDSLGTKLSVTCNTQSSLVLGTPRVTARTAATSFTISIDVAPTTNPMCISYSMMN